VQRVLLTGASGFIGRHLCDRLLRDGVEVHAVGRRRPENLTSEIRWQSADVGDLDAFRDAWGKARPDVVYHLAGAVTGDRSMDAVIPTLRANLEGTINAFLLAAESGCDRVIVTGSMEEPPPSDARRIAGSPYAAAKLAARSYACMFHALYSLPVVWLRVFMVYGPGRQDYTRIIPYTVLSLLQGNRPRLSSGERMVDWVFVEDVVEALVAGSTAADTAVGNIIDVGSGHLTSIRSVVEQLAAISGASITPEFGALPDRPLENQGAADLHDAQRLLQWTPRVTLAEGLKKTVEWFRAQEKLV
jgi:UDP-glucose 4-epimerase